MTTAQVMLESAIPATATPAGTVFQDTFMAADATDPTSRDLDTHPVVAGMSRWRYEDTGLSDDGGDPPFHATTAGRIVGNELVLDAGFTLTGGAFAPSTPYVPGVGLVFYGDGEEDFITSFPYFVFLHGDSGDPGGQIEILLYQGLGANDVGLQIDGGGAFSAFCDGDTSSYYDTFALGVGAHKVGIYVEATGVTAIADGAIVGTPSGDIGSAASLNHGNLSVTPGTDGGIGYIDQGSAISEVALVAGLTLLDAVALTA